MYLSQLLIFTNLASIILSITLAITDARLALLACSKLVRSIRVFKLHGTLLGEDMCLILPGLNVTKLFTTVIYKCS
jgi:hypothetical protein